MTKRLRWSGAGSASTLNNVRLNTNYTAPAGVTLASDWTARKGTQGVVWTHDFASSAEVVPFINQSTDPLVSTGISHVPAGGLTSGACRITIPGNPAPGTVVSMATQPPGSATTVRVVVSVAHQMIVGDKVRFFNLTGPWAAFNDAYDGNSGQVQAYDVTSIVNSTTIDMGTTASGIGTVNPSGFANYAGGGTAQRCRQASGNWMRPFSALSGATNGTGVNDVGAANLGMPLRTWPVTWAANRTYAYRYDYYGHADYASLLDTWFADDGNTNHLTNCYRGSDFWVQFRCKISASRWQDYNAPVRNPDSLKMFSIWSWETPFHEVVINDANTPKAPYSTYPASAGGVLDGYTSQGYSKTFWKGNHMQPLGDYDGTCLWTGQFPALVNSCWHMPPDEWVCFLLHVIPGKTVPNWGQDPDQNSPGHPLPGGWPNMTNYLGQDLTASATGIQLWACTQSRINTMKAANQTVTYQSLINCTGSNGFPFVYDNWQAPYAPADPPPGFHNLALLTYQNNIPVTFGWTRDYCQVIFKKGNGGTTVADGIPCPQI